jgi:hypothetical protein
MKARASLGKVSVMLPLLLLWGLYASGQQHTAIIIKGSHTFPATPSYRTWFLDTIDHKGFHWDGDKWFAFTWAQVKDIIPCRGFVYVPVEGTILCYGAFGRIEDQCQWFTCEDSIHLRWGKTTFTAAKARGIACELPSYCDEIKDIIQPDTVGGIRAYCLPLWEDHWPGDCDAPRTWGMLGTNGKWLIAPMFDTPFRFQDGTAKVVHYGQKRRINETGEFVE